MNNEFKRMQELAGVSVNEENVEELSLGQKAKGFLDKTVQSIKNMVGKSADGKEIANALRDLGLNPNGFTAYDVISKPDDLTFNYTLDIKESNPKQKVKVTQFQIDRAKRMKKNVVFRASQVKINLTDNVVKFESNEFALNFENGKYEPFKKGSQSIEPQTLSPEKNKSLGSDVDEFKQMTESPMSISIEDLRTRTGIEQKGITGTELEEKENLNEVYVAGGIVGIGAINHPKREKSDYEMAFEHFMTEGEEKVEEESHNMARPGTERETEKEEMDEGYYEEDDTMEEAVGIDASAEAIRGEVRRLIDKFDYDEDLGMAIRNKFSK